jgi:hypothetical protein
MFYFYHNNLRYLISVLSIVPPKKGRKPNGQAVAVSDNQILLFRCGIIDKTLMYEAEMSRWHENCYMGKVSTSFFHNNFQC